MSLNIIGISAYYHDSSCCLLQDGRLTYAAEEERFSRIKHDSGLPWRAFRDCLRHGGLRLPDIDAVAYYEDPQKKLARQVWMALHPQATELSRTKLVRRFDPHRVHRALREELGYEGPIEIFEHHQAHAASAFYYSGFEEAAIFTVDGVGEWATTTYGKGAGKTLELFEEVHFPHSLGLLYSTITGYLGFRVNSGEYKVMGLAPYGKPRYADQIRTLVEDAEGGQYRLRMEYFDFLRVERMHSDRLVELFGQPARTPESEIGTFHHDVAASLQAVLEEILLSKARYLHSKVPSDNLTMAGGVALNCVANARILQDGPFRRLFVQPAASDAGGALGAAALAHGKYSGERPQTEAMEHVLLGPSYGVEEIRRLLAGSSVEALDFRGDETGLLDAVSDRLADGKVIGWFHGRMEFGPRALGARSILADPRGPDMRDRINALVKMREAFRPFAPAVLAERTQDHFDLDHPAPFMLETCQVNSPLDLPAITHVNGSARVQTVHRNSSPRYAGLLDHFFAKTGCPILLNTSFNMRGEPIVCTPEDAIKCFVRSQIDVLVLEDFIIDREQLPDSWRDLVGPLPGRGPGAVSHAVYTLL